MKKLLRWPIFIMFAALMLMTTLVTVPLLHGSAADKAHAAGAYTHTTPTIVLSTAISEPGEAVGLTAQGFAAHEIVNLKLDSINAVTFAFFHSDGNGNFSGNIPMLSVNVTQGQHTVIARGASSGFTATTDVTIVPVTRISTGIKGHADGSSGSFIHIQGAGFAAQEHVSAHWQSTQGMLLGSGTSDTDGNLSLTVQIPAHATVGFYPVVIVRAHETPSTLSSYVHVTAPTLTTTTPGIHGPQYITVYFYGFQAKEKVAISWNANGGQLLKTLLASSTGDGTGTFLSHLVMKGAYTLTATGKTSGLTASCPIHVGPGITISPNTGVVPGSTMTVIGGGFTVGESVHIFVQGHGPNGITTTTDTKGSFSVALTAPVSYHQPNTELYVYANSTDGRESAKNYFTFAGVFANLGCSCIFGMPIPFTGQGFAVNEKVDIFWNYQLPSQIKAATVQAASDGTISFTLAIPSDPNIGRTPVAAIGETSKLSYSTDAVEYPGMALNHYSGRPGTKIHIMGGGFDSNESVTIFFMGTTLATVTSDITGNASMTYVVPNDPGRGDAAILAVGGTSGITVGATFGYTPAMTINPASGPSGTIITINGHHFSALNNIDIYWFDPSTGSKTYLNGANTNSNGTFTGQVTAPTGLTNGNQYFVQAWDGTTRLTTQLPFIAQSPCVQCIQLTPNSGIPGSTIGVSGTNFTAGETVNVYFQQVSNGEVSTTVSSTGTFTVSLTVPVTYQKNVFYYVYAVSTSGQDKASAQFFYTPPAIYADDPTDNFTYGIQGGFSGSGFGVNEPVNLLWNYGGKIGEFQAGTVTAGSDGSISATLTIPSIVYNTSISLVAYGTISHAKATTPVTEVGAIYNNPISGYVGTPETVTGGGYAAKETVTVQFEGSSTTTVATVPTNGRGEFTANFVVPSTDRVGLNVIIATGSTSGFVAYGFLNSYPTLSITPDKGPSGTVFQVTGSYYSPSTSYQILWYNPYINADTTLATVTSTTQGDVTATVTAPSGMTSGDTYYVQSYDPNLQTVWANAPFTIQ